MRIIAGNAKGTRLASLGKAELRPTLDRVRESVFNILNPHIQGSCWLDLFAGTGAVSMEAVSRGAARAVMVEPDRAAQGIILKNRANCKFDDSKLVLLKLEAARAMHKLEAAKESFDVVYVDPPFADGLYEPTLNALADGTLLKDDAWVLVEHFHKQALAGNYGRLTEFDKRRMGDTTVSFFAPE